MSPKLVDELTAHPDVQKHLRGRSRFVPFDAIATIPAGRRLIRQGMLARALYWFQISALELKAHPDSPDWLEALAECCASIRELLPDPELQLDNSPDIAGVLLDARQDLRNGLKPTWMTPRRLPPSRRAPSNVERRLRGVMVDSVQGLRQRYGISEREACKAVIQRLGKRTKASVEALRRWVRSGDYEMYCDLVEVAGVPERDDPRHWLNATVRAFGWVAMSPKAMPVSK